LILVIRFSKHLVLAKEQAYIQEIDLPGSTHHATITFVREEPATPLRHLKDRIIDRGGTAVRDLSRTLTPWSINASCGNEPRSLERIVTASTIDIEVCRMSVSLPDAHLEPNFLGNTGVLLPKSRRSSINHVVTVHKNVIQSLLIGPATLETGSDLKIDSKVCEAENRERKDRAHELTISLHAFRYWRTPFVQPPLRVEKFMGAENAKGVLVGSLV
jgi:hypothetical protein